MIKVTFSDPYAGWVDISISFPNANFDCVASYVPTSAIHEFVTQLPKLLRDRDIFSVWLNTEPDVYNLIGENHKGEELFKIIWYSKGLRTEANAKIILEEMCQGEELFIAIWRGLRSLQGRMDSVEFSKEWGLPFPEEAMERATRLRKELRQGK